MATAQVQQVMAAPVHGVKEEEKNHEIIQDDPPSAKVEEEEFDSKVHNNVNSKNEQVPASDTDEGQRIANEVEAKLAVKPVEAEAKEGQPRAAKKAEKASAKGVVVPIDDDTDDEVAALDGVKKPEKATAKWAVIPVDDEKDDDVVTPAGDQAPAAAPVASEEVAEPAGEEATKGGKEYACEEKAHEE